MISKLTLVLRPVAREFRRFRSNYPWRVVIPPIIDKRVLQCSQVGLKLRAVATSTRQCGGATGTQSYMYLESRSTYFALVKIVQNRQALNDDGQTSRIINLGLDKLICHDKIDPG